MNADRKLRPHEKHACFVGSGECIRDAAFEMDDGCGNPVYICAHHKPEFDSFEKAINEADPEIVERFAEAVEQAHKEAKIGLN